MAARSFLKFMTDSRLKCDFPETNLEQNLEKRLYRTYGEKVVRPQAKKVVGISDSSCEMSYGVAFISERFMDIRTAFSAFRSFHLGIINLFMISALLIMLAVDHFFSGAINATAALLLPLWIGIYLFEILFPLTLPVRIDRQKGFVYVGHRGTFYRIPWDEFEVTFSYNLQYLGSGVVWDRQYYSHFYLRDKHFFCGKKPKRSLQRKRVSSSFNEDRLYRRWNFIVRYFQDGLSSEDLNNLSVLNYDDYRKDVSGKKISLVFFDVLSVILLAPTIFIWKFAPFKYKWPSEIEAEFGKANYY